MIKLLDKVQRVILVLLLGLFISASVVAVYEMRWYEAAMFIVGVAALSYVFREERSQKRKHLRFKWMILLVLLLGISTVSKAGEWVRYPKNKVVREAEHSNAARIVHACSEAGYYVGWPRKPIQVDMTPDYPKKEYRTEVEAWICFNSAHCTSKNQTAIIYIVDFIYRPTYGMWQLLTIWRKSARRQGMFRGITQMDNDWHKTYVGMAFRCNYPLPH